MPDKKKNKSVLNIELDALLEISEVMILTEDLKTLFDLVIDKICRIMGIELCSLMLVDAKKQEMTIESARGLPEHIVKKARLKIGENIAGWVVKSKEPLLIPNVAQDTRFQVRNGDKYVNSSLLSVPLKIRGKVIGVLNVNNKVSGGTFNEDDLRLLTILADQAAIAIENARLYRKLSRAKRILSRNEKKMKQMVKDMKKMDKMKDEFISIVSHELRTPLTSVKEAVSLLLDEIPGQINDDQREFLNLAMHDTSRLNRLLNDILNLSRMEAGKLQMYWESSDIKEVVNHALNSMRPMSLTKEIELLEEAADGLEPIVLDKDKVEQILINLVSNAIKFSPNKGQIKIKVGNDGDYYKISVIDSGIGMPPEELPHIFNKFRQIDSSSTRKVGGSGLGLSIVKGLVQAHKGNVWVESKVGKGTTFFFTLAKGMKVERKEEIKV